MKSTLVNRNVTVGGHRTSIRLEPSMWTALEEICHRELRTVHEICTEVDSQRYESTLTAALRAFIVVYYRIAATEDGHLTAGHGPLSRLQALQGYASRPWGGNGQPMNRYRNGASAP